MIKTLREMMSPSMVVASLSLFVALSGTALAASRYIITSGQQIKPGVIAVRHLSQSARASLRGNEGPQGPPGKDALANAHVYSHSQSVPANTWFYYFILCASGERAIGGGANTSSSQTIINESHPVDQNGNPVGNGAVPAGWLTKVGNFSSRQLTITYYAVCA